MKSYPLLLRFSLLTVLSLLAFVQRAKADTFFAPQTADFENTTPGGPIVDNGAGYGGVQNFSTNGTWNIVAGSGNLPTNVLENNSAGGVNYATFYLGRAGAPLTGFTESTDFLFSSASATGSSYTDVGLASSSYNIALTNSDISAQFVLSSSDSSTPGQTTGNLLLTNLYSPDNGYSGITDVLASLATGLTPTIGDKYNALP
ncbi:MAG: hypothetical protein WDO13_12070 [Verrucomicrobiota bacterium]